MVLRKREIVIVTVPRTMAFVKRGTVFRLDPDLHRPDWRSHPDDAMPRFANQPDEKVNLLTLDMWARRGILRRVDVVEAFFREDTAVP